MFISRGIFLFSFFASFWAASLQAATKISVLPHDTQIEWVGKKVTGQHKGVLSLKEGSLTLDSGKIQAGKFVVDMTSLKNLDIEDPKMNQKLVSHLKSDDFFSVDKFPNSELEILSIKETPKSSPSSHEVEAKLSIKGVTQNIKFPATVKIAGDKLSWSSVLKIDRTLFNVRYGSGKFFDKLGDKLIYDEFEVSVKFSTGPLTR